MRFLTQTNVTILFAIQVMWGVYVASGIFPHAHWVDAVNVSFNAITAGLAVLGFNRTPSGNRLPPDVITAVDRHAVITQAQDVVVKAAADAVVENVKEPK